MTRVVSLLLHDVYQRDPSESGFSGPAADRYKLSAREFDAQLAGLVRVRKDRPVLVSDSAWVAHDGVPFAITVDDGGVSYYTTVADRLEALGWRGHCFVTTGMIGRPGFLDKAQIRELRARGHIIGSHSVSHPTRFSACRWDEMVREWDESRRALEDILGQDVRVASVAGGFFSPRVSEAAREAGLTVLFTSEPETRVRSIGGCLVMGRFIVRRGCRADFARSLAVQQRSTIFREWIGWNMKKVLKAFLRGAYPWLVGLWHRIA